MFSDSDQRFMQLALDQGRLGRFWTRPNPAVGCVLTRGDQIIGQGFTQPAGGNHAEVEALRDAGDATGATAYVTLEPCAHQGRTGPCAEALIAAGVSRVVAAIEDPFHQVSGGGFERLRAAGVDVSVGLMAEQAELQLAGFLARMRRGWGRVRLKLAASFDGRSAMASGESQWITGPEARGDVQLLRAESCAIVTGVGTVLADDCRLTVRAEQLPLTGAAKERALALPPLRVLLDSHGRAPLDAAIFASEARTVRLLGAGSTPVRDEDDVVLPVAQADGRVQLAAVREWLASQPFNEILVEAGPTLGGAMLEAGLVDEMICYVAPKLLGRTAQPMLALDRALLAEVPELVFRDVTPIGDDLRIIAVPKS